MKTATPNIRETRHMFKQGDKVTFPLSDDCIIEWPQGEPKVVNATYDRPYKDGTGTRSVVFIDHDERLPAIVDDSELTPVNPFDPVQLADNDCPACGHAMSMREHDKGRCDNCSHYTK